MSTNNPSLVVQRLDRATDLAVSTGLPVKCLVFPATGGLQAIDAAGTILPLVGPSGSLIPSADNVDNLGDFLTPLRWANGYFAGSVMAAQLTSFVSGTPNVSSLMVKFTPVASSANYVNITNAIVNNAPIVAANGSDANVDLRLDGKGNGVVNPQSPLVITPPVRTGAAATTGALEVAGAANTAVLTGTEASDVIFDLARTVTWAAGSFNEQRAVNIQAPTYVISGGASTITTAATLSIADAPTAGAATVIARSYALHVPSGLSNLAGGVGVSTGTNNDIVTSLNVARLVDSPVSGVAGVGANNIGSRITITTANSSGVQVMSGFASGVLSDATAASEVGYLSLGGAFAGTGSEALRLIGLTGTIVTRVDVTPGATGVAPIIAAAGGGTNAALALRPLGTSASLSFIDLQDGAGLPIARCFRSATPVNYVALRSSNNGSAVGIGAGSDTSTDVAVSIRGLGNGQIQIDGQTGTGGVSIGVNAASRVGFYAATPVVRASAISAPTAPGAFYSQAEAITMETAVNAIRTALLNIGITL